MGFYLQEEIIVVPGSRRKGGPQPDLLVLKYVGGEGANVRVMVRSGSGRWGVGFICCKVTEGRSGKAGLGDSSMAERKGLGGR